MSQGKFSEEIGRRQNIFPWSFLAEQSKKSRAAERESPRCCVGKDRFAPTLNLKSIALSCGFCDPSHFNKAIRSSTGLSPTQFRQLSVKSHITRPQPQTS